MSYYNTLFFVYFLLVILCVLLYIIDTVSKESDFDFFFNDTATTEIYTNRSSAASDVYKRQVDILNIAGFFIFIMVVKKKFI